MSRGTMYGIIGLAVIAALLVFSCGGPKDPVVAKVGDHGITLGDFNIAYKAITIFNRPPLVTYEDAEAFLQTLINKEILVTEAKSRGLDRDPLLQKARENWLMEQCIRTLFKEVAEADMQITLAEVEDYYRRARSQVRARQILVGTLPAAEEIRRKLEKGEDFAVLARANSIDEASRALGGELGVVDHGQLDPPLERAVFSLNPGEISEPVRTALGFHILQVQEKIEPSMDDFEEQRHACAAELRSRRRNENWSTYLAEVESRLDIRFNDENVHAFNDALPPRENAQSSDWYQKMDDAFRARVLAEYAGGTWTVGEFLGQYGPDVGGLPFRSEDADMIYRVSEAAIVNKWNYDEAKRRGLDRLDETIRAVDRKEQERLLELLHDDLVKDAVVPDEKVRELYEEQKAALIMPDRAHLMIINTPDVEMAKEARDKLRRGVPFEEVSKEYNEGALRELGGDMGMRLRSNIAPELIPYAFGRLRPGQVSDVVPHRQGYFVAKLVALEREHPMTYEESEPELRGMLLAATQDSVFAEWILAKREEVGVEIFPESLNLIVEEAETEEP
ncbi:MAG: peptidylprolyl isomerase [Candidatus Eisenbacteria bacterium]|nr:peptidylprolyl isomerase [Candidatus Eisenbacteria bacterium]